MNLTIILILVIAALAVIVVIQKLSHRLGEQTAARKNAEAIVKNQQRIAKSDAEIGEKLNEKLDDIENSDTDTLTDNLNIMFD